jgi:hypothetical protein
MNSRVAIPEIAAYEKAELANSTNLNPSDIHKDLENIFKKETLERQIKGDSYRTEFAGRCIVYLCETMQVEDKIY